MNNNIPINKLFLWDENARFPDLMSGENEKTLIRHFLKHEDTKILELAKRIAEDIDLPQLEKLVVYFDGENYFVREGNRRLTAYKLLCNPELADTKENVQYFQTLRGTLKLQIHEGWALECLVFETEEQCDRFINRKHIQHNNEVHWQDTERANYKIRSGNGKKSDHIKKELRKIIVNLEIPKEIKEAVLGKGYVTTLWRILTSKPAEIKYGYGFDNDNKLKIKNKSFQDELEAIIVDIYNKTITSRTHNRNNEIEKYINEIDDIYINKNKMWIEDFKASPIQTSLVNEVPEKVQYESKRKTPTTKERGMPFFGGKLFLQKGDVNNLYSDISRVYCLYQSRNNEFSEAFPLIIRASLRLLVERASGNSTTNGVRDYVDTNFAVAKKELTKDEKNFLSLHHIKEATDLKSLLECGGHGYSASKDMQQTIAMSTIIGKMLMMTHSKE